MSVSANTLIAYPDSGAGPVGLTAGERIDRTRRAWNGRLAQR